MDFDYIVADPTGNITVLILSPYSSDAERREMIREAFSREPACEQVGFIALSSDKVTHLEMMGFEFCGNATLSSAAWYLHTQGMQIGEESSAVVKSSGTEDLLSVKVRRLPDADPANCFTGDPIRPAETLPAYMGTVNMPTPAVSSFRGYPMVQFTGITHLIMPASEYTDAEAESAIAGCAEELGVSALGFMLCEEYDDLVASYLPSGSVTMRPLVYVPDSGTCIWEHGCATGSTAIGWYRYYQDSRNYSTEIKQPGGVIRVDSADGHPALTGTVVFRSGR